MNSKELFAMGLGLEKPWEIKEITFVEGEQDKELHIIIDFKKGGKFPDETGTLCDVYRTKQKEWRHLNFFQ